MELKLKLWHILAFFGIVIISGSIFLGVWVRTNNEKIAGLNKEIKAYDRRIRELDAAYKELQTIDYQKSMVIDSLQAVIGEKEKSIASLRWSIARIKTELQYEKDRIRALDSVQQFGLLRTNLDSMLNRAGSGGN